MYIKPGSLLSLLCLLQYESMYEHILLAFYVLLGVLVVLIICNCVHSLYWKRDICHTCGDKLHTPTPRSGPIMTTVFHKYHYHCRPCENCGTHVKECRPVRLCIGKIKAIPIDNFTDQMKRAPVPHDCECVDHIESSTISDAILHDLESFMNREKIGLVVHPLVHYLKHHIDMHHMYERLCPNHESLFDALCTTLELEYHPTIKKAIR